MVNRYVVEAYTVLLAGDDKSDNHVVRLVSMMNRRRSDFRGFTADLLRNISITSTALCRLRVMGRILTAKNTLNK